MPLWAARWKTARIGAGNLNDGDPPPAAGSGASSDRRAVAEVALSCSLQRQPVWSFQLHPLTLGNSICRSQQFSVG